MKSHGKSRKGGNFLLQSMLSTPSPGDGTPLTRARARKLRAELWGDDSPKENQHPSPPKSQKKRRVRFTELDTPQSNGRELAWARSRAPLQEPIAQPSLNLSDPSISASTVAPTPQESREYKRSREKSNVNQTIIEPKPTPEKPPSLPRTRDRSSARKARAGRRSPSLSPIPRLRDLPTASRIQSPVPSNPIQPQKSEETPDKTRAARDLARRLLGKPAKTPDAATTPLRRSSRRRKRTALFSDTPETVASEKSEKSLPQAPMTRPTLPTPPVPPTRPLPVARPGASMFSPSPERMHESSTDDESLGVRDIEREESSETLESFVGEVNSKKSSFVGEVNSKKSSFVGEVNSKKSSFVEEVNSKKSSFVEEVNSKKSSFVGEVNSNKRVVPLNKKVPPFNQKVRAPSPITQSQSLEGSPQSSQGCNSPSATLEGSPTMSQGHNHPQTIQQLEREEEEEEEETMCAMMSPTSKKSCLRDRNFVGTESAKQKRRRRRRRVSFAESVDMGKDTSADLLHSSGDESPKKDIVDQKSPLLNLSWSGGSSSRLSHSSFESVARPAKPFDPTQSPIPPYTSHHRSPPTSRSRQSRHSHHQHSNNHQRKRPRHPRSTAARPSSSQNRTHRDRRRKPHTSAAAIRDTRSSTVDPGRAPRPRAKERADPGRASRSAVRPIAARESFGSMEEGGFGGGDDFVGGGEEFYGGGEEFYGGGGGGEAMNLTDLLEDDEEEGRMESHGISRAKRAQLENNGWRVVRRAGRQPESTTLRGGGRRQPPPESIRLGGGGRQQPPPESIRLRVAEPEIEDDMDLTEVTTPRSERSETEMAEVFAHDEGVAVAGTIARLMAREGWSDGLIREAIGLERVPRSTPVRTAVVARVPAEGLAGMVRLRHVRPIALVDGDGEEDDRPAVPPVPPKRVSRDEPPAPALATVVCTWLRAHSRALHASGIPPPAVLAHSAEGALPVPTLMVVPPRARKAWVELLCDEGLHVYEHHGAMRQRWNASGRVAGAGRASSRHASAETPLSWATLPTGQHTSLGTALAADVVLTTYNTLASAEWTPQETVQHGWIRRRPKLTLVPVLQDDPAAPPEGQPNAAAADSTNTGLSCLHQICWTRVLLVGPVQLAGSNARARSQADAVSQLGARAVWSIGMQPGSEPIAALAAIATRGHRQ